MVALKGINDIEIVDFCDFALEKNLHVRFIEFMPFTNNGWQKDLFIESSEIKRIVENNFHLEPIESKSSVSMNYKIKRKYSDSIKNDKYAKLGFISSISNHFCIDCNRLRITADGKLKLCLFSTKDESLDLAELIRDVQFSNTKIFDKINEFLQKKEKEHKPIDELIKLKSNNMFYIGG